MADVRRWRQRTPEEAYLFNPAFLGSLVYEFVRTYSKDHENTPLTLAFVGVSASLHGETRRRLPYSTVSSLYGWLQDNEALLIKFADRTKGLTPYLKEAVIFSLSDESLEQSAGHSFKVGRRRVGFTPAFLEDSTGEISDIVDRTRFMARWFAKSGSEASILAAWGVRP